jgi:hypothetical protein
MKQARFGGKQTGSYAGSKIGSLDQRLTGGAVSEGVDKANATVSNVKSRAGSRIKEPKTGQGSEFMTKERKQIKSGGKRAVNDARVGTNFVFEILTAHPSIGRKQVSRTIAKIPLSTHLRMGQKQTKVR